MSKRDLERYIGKKKASAWLDGLRKEHASQMTLKEYKKEVERLLDDPRSDPDSDWHEQWLIDLQDLGERYDKEKGE